MRHKIEVDTPVHLTLSENLHDKPGPGNMLCAEAIAAGSDLNYSAIVITDLNAVIALYRQHSLAEGNSPHSPFTFSFGLPVYKAVYKKTVVGYSFYTLQDGSPNLRCYLRKGWNRGGIAERLHFLSKDVGGNSLSPASRELFSDASRLREGIEQLVNWLNRSV